LGGLKCNGLVRSLKNILFTDVFWCDNGKLVSAVLKTDFIYLLLSLKKFKALKVP